MAVAFDAAASGLANSASSLSWSHTTSGSDRILYVLVGGWDGNGRTATCTYGGTSMTLEATSALSNGNDRIWCFRLANPATGANTVAVTITGGSMHLRGGSLSWTSAHQSSFGAPVTTASSANGTSASSAVTDGASGDGIADGVISGNDATHAVNGPASHTERWDLSSGGTGESGAGGNSDGAAGSVTVGWTISVSSSWAHCAVTVKQTAVAVADPWTTRTPGVQSLRSRTTDFHQRSVRARALWQPQPEDGPLPTQPDTWAQPIPGTAFMRSRAVDRARIAATTNDLRWWLAELNGPLPLQPDTYQPPIPGTRALRTSVVARMLRATTTQWFRWHGSEYEGPLPEQPDTWTQPPVGWAAWTWRALLPKRLTFFPSADVTTPPVPLEEPTWAQPVPGTFSLQATRTAVWRRASTKVWPYGDYTEGELPPQPDTYQPPTPGTSAIRQSARQWTKQALSSLTARWWGDYQDGPLPTQQDTYTQPVPGPAAWTWRRLLPKRLTFFPFGDVIPPPAPPEPDTWMQQPIPGTRNLQMGAHEWWRRAAKVWPYGAEHEGELPVQPDTYQPPVQGTASLRRAAVDVTRRVAGSIWSRPWGDYESGPLPAQPDTYQPPIPGTGSVRARTAKRSRRLRIWRYITFWQWDDQGINIAPGQTTIVGTSAASTDLTGTSVTSDTLTGSSVVSDTIIGTRGQ